MQSPIQLMSIQELEAEIKRLNEEILKSHGVELGRAFDRKLVCERELKRVLERTKL